MTAYLLTDLGIAHIRTVLLGQVEGQYRLVLGTTTPSTLAAPQEDAWVGLQRTVQQLEHLTGQRLYNPQDETFQVTFLATASSTGRSLRAVLLGLMDLSLTSAQRALTGTYLEVVATLSVMDINTEEERINTILRYQPDVIFIVGGTDDGNDQQVRDLVRLVSLAVRLIPNREERPLVLYAGNSALRGWFTEQFNSPFGEPYTTIYTADNVRPALEEENLTSAKRILAQVYDFYMARRREDFRRISGLSARGIAPTAQSALNIVRYLDNLHQDAGIICVDLGSSTSALLASYQDQASAHIRSNLGLGHSLLSLLEAVDWRDVDRWLPFPFSLDALEEWVYNKWLAPTTIPHNLRDLFIELAIAREIVRVLVRDASLEWTRLHGTDNPPFALLILTGAVFTGSLPPGLAVLVALDALQPAGVLEVWLDPTR
ncbi:MAG: hypothetical protein HC915_20140 [Anaerolineae bacterium]|nr:hypothetical protein [Anaerolineae bacterium]